MTLKDLWNKLDVVAVIGFLIAIETQISNGSMSLAHTLPDAWLPVVKEQAANLASIGGALIGIIRMAGNSSQSSVTSTVVKILLAAFALSLLFPMSEASAQSSRGTRQQQPFDLGAKIKKDVDDTLTGANQPAAAVVQTAREKMGCDLLNLKPGCKTAKAADDFKNLDDAMSEPMKEFVAFVQGDVSTAISLTSKIAGLPDGNGQACLQQLQMSGDIVKSLQETVSNGGTVGIATAFEALRLLHMNMIKTCNNVHCTQMFNEATNVIAAAAPMKMQIPSLTQICSQIPSIAMEPVTPTDATATPVIAPASAPAPAPSASPTP